MIKQEKLLPVNSVPFTEDVKIQGSDLRNAALVKAALSVEEIRNGVRDRLRAEGKLPHLPSENLVRAANALLEKNKAD